MDEDYGIDKIDVNNDRSQENNIQIKKQPKILKPNEEVTITNFYEKSSHPTISLISVILKLSSIISFIILSIFTSNDALIMIIVILLGA